ncbi:STAS/SEC14 domain-containing protein [Halosimplex marinum]|uniref:STAS/SEC14 domain-containing protein n=1 Tax=Halosimplex marinum TaxID=3396620 RepID=UPI003F563C06
MTENDPSALRATGQTPSPMFEVLEATSEDVVAVRMHHGTPAGYREFYDLLVEKTNEYGSVHVYEEARGWTMTTYLSHLHGIRPDLRTGPKFEIDRYAAVGDSRWAKLLYHQWRAIAPVWPVAPAEMRYYELPERKRALDWVAAATSTKQGQ